MYSDIIFGTRLQLSKATLSGWNERKLTRAMRLHYRRFKIEQAIYDKLVKKQKTFARSSDGGEQNSSPDAVMGVGFRQGGVQVVRDWCADFAESAADLEKIVPGRVVGGDSPGEVGDDVNDGIGTAP